MVTRRQTFRIPLTLMLLSVAFHPAVARAAPPARPNVVLIMTDDQGWGDVGVHGNAAVRTPHLDRLARDGVRLTRFYAGPVCTPTRASLMTGRYHLRTRAIDTYRGRAIMHPDEVTVAETLAAAGYSTGIFGKWHLGDHHPSRPIDQGFREALVHWGGGIAQPADPPQGNSYFDPWLEHNGKLMKTRGYCSDVYTDAAIRFIDDARPEGAATTPAAPFFVYLAFNAPHDPLQVSEDLVRPYRDAGVDEGTAKVYAMVENLDANVGRLLAHLEARKLGDNTLVLFLSDNGPAGARFNGGFRGAKGSVYEGGIRVPCFMRWPAGFEGGRAVDRVAAHIDLAPTILAACGVAPPEGLKMDGLSLLPLLQKGGADWTDRTLYFQWHRGDAAEPGRACAAVSQRYKLVQPKGAEEGPGPKDATWELYDLAADPGEQHDLAASTPEVVAEMRAGYDAWFADVSATRGYGPVSIHLGSVRENPVLLTRQDWRGAGWAKTDAGHWQVHVARPGRFKLTLMFDPSDHPRQATVAIGKMKVRVEVPAGQSTHVINDMGLTGGDARVEAVLVDNGATSGVRYVQVERTE